ncbi:RNA methyltransferase [bacterium]|nr:RNA methyltransferase [bacterium]
MEKITSVSNNLVKETLKLQQKKYREQTGKFLLEGFKPVCEAFECGLNVEYVFVDEKKVALYKFLGEKVIATNEVVLKKISTTDSSPECVGVAFQKETVNKSFKNFKKVLLLENIKDAGNLGTILRTSAAFGVELVILYGDCVDLYNPKVVRSAVGCLWKLPIVQIHCIDALEENFKNHMRIATLPRSKNLLSTFEVKEPYLVMFGSEAHGLSDELINFANSDVKIEMNENVESLNLSISCGVVLYKLLIH